MGDASEQSIRRCVADGSQKLERRCSRTAAAARAGKAQRRAARLLLPAWRLPTERQGASLGPGARRCEAEQALETCHHAARVKVQAACCICL